MMCEECTVIHCLSPPPPPPPPPLIPHSPHIQSIKDTAAHLGQLAEARSQRIQEAIERQQQLDELRLNFAKKAAVSHH